MDETGLDLTSPPPSEIPPTNDQTISIYVDSKNVISVENSKVNLESVPLQVERLLANRPGSVIMLRADAGAALHPVVNIRDNMQAAGRHVTMQIERPTPQ